MKRKILITGTDGFIAKHLIKKLNDKYKLILVSKKKNGDLSVPKNWKNIKSADTVIHLANKNQIRESLLEPSLYLTNNINCTLNVLEYCRKNNANLVYLSTYLYGKEKKFPEKETNKILISNPYALSKYLCENLIKNYFKLFKIKSVILRAFNTYGPNQKKYFLIPAILNAFLNNQTLNIENDKLSRDFVYIDDLVNAIIKSINYKKNFLIANIGSGTTIKVFKIIKIFEQKFKKKIKIVTFKNISSALTVSKTHADIKLAMKELNWKPRYSIEKGIKKLIDHE